MNDTTFYRKDVKYRISTECIFAAPKTYIMNNLIYLIAIILIIAWAAGYFAFGAGGIIHVLLIIAIIAILLRVIKGNNPL